MAKEKAADQGGSSIVPGDQAETTLQNQKQTNHTPILIPIANTAEADADNKAKRSRSTSTGAQIAKLLAFLRDGPRTTHFLRTQGISHPAGRVQDLRDDEYEILTQRVNSIDSDGFTHINAAQYVLLKEPPKQMSLIEQGGK